MPTFGVRSILQWQPRVDQRKKYLYEERITLWNSRTFGDAINLAEREADAYASPDAKYLGLLQGFWLFNEVKLRKQGVEVFSLLRASDLPPKAYLRTFFDTGFEREGSFGNSPDTPGPRRSRTRRNRKRARR